MWVVACHSYGGDIHDITYNKQIYRFGWLKHYFKQCLLKIHFSQVASEFQSNRPFPLPHMQHDHVPNKQAAVGYGRNDAPAAEVDFDVKLLSA